MTTESYLDLRLTDLLERLSAEGRAPGSGSAAAMTIAFAAGLVAMAARTSTSSWSDAGGIAAQALAIRDRAGELASTDAEMWGRAMAALARVGDARDPRRDFALEQELDRAASLPLEIAELGADAATLAAVAADRCDGAYRADAAAAAALAAGSARAAAHLVEVNLAVREDDARLVRARASARDATEAADRVLASSR
ncbi:MAG: cyclodeaminase/cyclohydrolase family protein [Gaiellaceae bacterium]